MRGGEFGDTLLTVGEVAEVMRVSPGIIKREWAVAKGWLYRELGGA